ARLYDRALTADEVAASAGTIRTSISDEEVAAALDEATRARRKHLAAELMRLKAEIHSFEGRKAFAVTPQDAHVIRLLVRGNVLQPAEPLAPGGLLGMTASHPSFDLAPDASDADRRRKLAAWIASPDNPTFARTIVNRLWHYHFGRGLVETTNALGCRGGQPSHPDLLDWLAAELIEHRWSLKHVHKLIVTSAT